MSDLFYTNNVPLCKKHYDDLMHAVMPQCQHCLIDEKSAAILLALQASEEITELKKELEQVKTERDQAIQHLKRVQDVGLKLSIALDIEKFLERVGDGRL